jgi:hypothetical protein
MKKIFLSILFFTLLIQVKIFAQTDNDAFIDEIKGTWFFKNTEFYMNEKSSDLKNKANKLYGSSMFAIYKNKTFQLTREGKMRSGTFTFDGDDIVLSFRDGGEERGKVFLAPNAGLGWVVTIENKKMSIIFEK